MFRLAHISDVHLPALPQPRLRELASKRIIGYVNWRQNRKQAMTEGSLDLLTADIVEADPDHIVVTGDLTNLALRQEFENARLWLQALGPPTKVTAIPGNHDAYVPRAHHRYRALWAPWMRGDIDETDDSEHIDRAIFPFMRRKGNVAIIGLSSAVASAPFMATGRLGRRQTARLETLLQEARDERLFRVVLVHHPPKLIDPGRALRRLTDGYRLRRAVERFGAELVLHGHDHIRAVTAIRGPHGTVPVIGVPAGSSGPSAGPKSGGYALHEVEESPDCWHLTVIHRCLDESGGVKEAMRVQFDIKRR
ncbi:3',5'-cyclic AMP phosphodiesterase CpdA [Rhodopseudomonas julia]|uniref:3',5'-cyclic AMP phosphodiesterase CpdA n=1 Tax=Rhodopseudomonas julia TaxID=200617 RepID=A0ABU0CAI1_9BRAD|nr:metallophosphoesterase [Rhodopseudomonas julia]MDQ0327540.1 3',5'-cyclic AMP phosphodiesterase CpdA [Rhodopseudomonas julia]